MADSFSENGLKFLKELEGFRAMAYECSAKKWTIGYGTTRYWSGFPVKEHDIITEDAAIKELNHYIDSIESLILRFVDKEKVNQNQFDAVISFVYNIGSANFSSSTMLIYLQAYNWLAAAEEFPKWNKITVKVDGKYKKVVCDGLTKRRAKERALFLS